MCDVLVRIEVVDLERQADEAYVYPLSIYDNEIKPLSVEDFIVDNLEYIKPVSVGE